ncbi:UDP-N-acetylmuramate dehydrogenase [Mangrovimonas sp. AS39]|uniref:UDP-N-acetylmuramate dehydrogenase n=1 Tax=Mangrovimonas futianensis TaxID=2895523 RepID=UPI001E365F34|nr:UDP-N-acetylmuramate dehydrogenase [Mangrovimonas futianensis]MCF1194398.1 UDP-N-acetylmuramate dehydrogenase [Mangrovimonas futianensis]
MIIHKNISLRPYNTFGIDVKASSFISISDVEELKEVLDSKEYPDKFILGGGSNMLLTKDVDALVIHVNLKGIEILKDNSEHVWVKANAGEVWHEFVLFCLKNNLGGIENLSLIPGNVGTAPIQNIGAYGVELKDVMESCEALNIKTKEIRSFSNAECQFGYRNSIFKTQEKGNFIITSVTFKLTKRNHVLHTEYGAITQELDSLEIQNPTIQDVSRAVINIRESKLPNPKEIGNSGSFFKNPVISSKAFEKLKENFPDIPGYVLSDSEVKVPAGWLIETAGFKGKTFKNYGVHTKQALVLVNYGGASGQEIYQLSKLIQTTVRRIFDISIEAEVNII